MDRDHGTTTVHGLDDPRSRKGRLMGKLFGGRERKASNELRDSAGDDEINAFLHGPSAGLGPASSPHPSTTATPSFDSFQVAHAAPPQLAKLDTRSVSRYPHALPIASSIASSHSSTTAYSAIQHSKPNGKGLVVRFVDTYPEIIGEGGDEAETPTIEIGKRRRTRPHAPSAASTASMPNLDSAPFSAVSSRSIPLRSPLPPAPPPKAQQQQRPPDSDDNFVPAPIRRTQTGFSIISEHSSPADWKATIPPERRRPAVPEKVAAGQLAPAPFLDAPVLGHDEKRRSFIEIHQAEMRKAEGLAFSNAVRDNDSPPTSPEADDKRSASPSKRSPAKMTPPPPLPPPRHPRHTNIQQTAPVQNLESSPILPPPSAASTPEGQPRTARPRQVAQEYNPPAASPSVPPAISSPTSAVQRAYHAFRQNANSRLSSREPDDDATSVASGASTTSPKPVIKDLHDVVQAAADDAFNTFVSRSRHLFELFRLQSETLRPLASCAADDLARAGLWWFIIGRMALENAFRERSGPAAADSPMSRSNEFAMQQAYADLAKAYWLVGEILPDALAGKESSADDQVEQVRTALFYNLRKLAMSMKRNDLLPPEDAFLPQTIDKTIWANYPAVSADITALLWGYWGSSLMSSPLSTPPMTMLEALPVSDSAQDFIFSRMWSDVYLMEQGRESSPDSQQQFHFPCLLSVARPQNSAALEVIIASQNGTVQLRVQGKKNPGPVWEDVRWRSDVQALEIRLPRGFLLVVQLSKQDFGLLWSMYDFGAKVHSQLYPRNKDENPVFRTTLKAFQYFESGQSTGSFPREAVPDCEIALFEKTLQEVAAKGPRRYHRGFRLAVVSGTRTRTLYGVSHAYLPDMPVRFNFLLSDLGDPALLLRFENSRSKGSMVLSFAKGDERMHLQSLLAGTAINNTERTVADVPISSLDVKATSGGKENRSDYALSIFKKMAINRLRIINHDDEADDTAAPTVLAEKLRMVFEFGDCSIVDRINVAPGEFKIRLDVRNRNCLTILRQPQQDLTLAVSEMQVPKEMGPELADGLYVVKTASTCRMLRFPTLADLHTVQMAVTGYRVLFDAVATTFAIARRRMVVPIHKKWEAGSTRIQVVLHPDTKIVQLLAFFQDFHYGHCMSFVLKGTDVFETFGRGSKAGIKLDDAKFPLPRMATGSESGVPGGMGGGMDGGSGTGAGRASLDHSRNVEYNEAAFVCLDMPDLPGEHDDISILFDSETDRDRMAACLPAPVRGSRLAKMF